MFLMGNLPPGKTEPCVYCMYNMVAGSQILHVPSYFSCGLRHSWLSSIEKLKKNA